MCSVPSCGSSHLCEQRPKHKSLNGVAARERDYLAASSCSPSAAMLQAVMYSLSADPVINKITARNGDEQRLPAGGEKM